MIEMTAGLAVLAMPALKVVIEENQACIRKWLKSGSTTTEGSNPSSNPSSNQDSTEFCLKSRCDRILRDFRHGHSPSKDSDGQTRPETSDEASLVDHYQALPKV